MEVSLDRLASDMVDEPDGRASYANGVLVPPKPGATADPKPAAANDGTVITVRRKRIERAEHRADVRPKTCSTTCRYANGPSNPPRMSTTGCWT